MLTRNLCSTIFTSIVFAACGQGGSGSAPPPGNFAVLDQHSYPYFDLNQCLNNSDANEIVTKLQANKWTQVEHVEDNPNCTGVAGNGYQSDPAVLASMFSDSNAESADMLWYSGHGNDGFIALRNYNPDNPGDCAANGGPNVECFDGISAGLPMSGRLKWLFSYASVSTADVRWEGIFNTTSAGLHGYYGVEGEPSDLPSTDMAVADTFASQAIGSGANGALPIHDAWQKAIGVTGVSFGEWELEDAEGDQLGSTTLSTGLETYQNEIVYTDEQGQTYYPEPFNPTTGTNSYTTSPGQYIPLAMTTESYSDSSLASAANAQDPGISQSYPTPNEFRMVGQHFVASHYEGSQGLIASAASTLIPMNYAESVALNFALQAQTNYNALPADAQLQNVTGVYQTTGSEAPVLVGYDFIWKHSTPILGGDFIRMGVDNTEQKVCTQTETLPITSPHGVPEVICIKWETEYTLHLNFYYRLWREPIQQRFPTGVNGTGAAALSPAQALAAANTNLTAKGWALGSATAYLYGFWTPPITSTDNTAYPAYHFLFANHNVVSVDAYSGTVYSIDEFEQ